MDLMDLMVFTQTNPAISSDLFWNKGYVCVHWIGSWGCHIYIYIICPHFGQIKSTVFSIKIYALTRIVRGCNQKLLLLIRILKGWNECSSRMGVGYRMFHLCADHWNSKMWQTKLPYIPVRVSLGDWQVITSTPFSELGQVRKHVVMFCT